MPNYEFSATWVDADNDESVVTGFLTALSQAAAETALTVMLTNMDLLSDAALRQVTLSVPIDTDAWTIKSAPVANSDVEIGGRFIFAAANIRYTKQITVPGFKKNDFVTNKIINLANATVDQFVDSVLLNDFSTKHFEDLTQVVKGYEVFNGRP